MSWNKRYHSTGYDLACDNYDKAPIILSGKEYPKTDNMKKVYISELSRTRETAERLFQKNDFVQTALLNEVPLKSYKDSNKMYPLWLWNFAGRLQWFLQNSRQPESKKETADRAKKLIKMLETRQEDCYLITHGFYMRVLIKELRKQGYQMEKNNLFKISNLDMITAAK